ncbi:DNA-binding response OmpR family regulator [Bradyrhizobium sp. JR6.1]
MRLLIVEDNLELSRLLASGLVAAGYESPISSTALPRRVMRCAASPMLP